MSDFNLTYMLADVTGEKRLASPVQDFSTPCYLGTGELPVSGATFVHGALTWRARTLLAEGHPMNPFPCVLVMAELA